MQDYVLIERKDARQEIFAIMRGIIASKLCISVIGPKKRPPRSFGFLECEIDGKFYILCILWLNPLLHGDHSARKPIFLVEIGDGEKYSLLTLGNGALGRGVSKVFERSYARDAKEL